MEQLSFYDEESTIKLSEILAFLNAHATPEYLLGYKEEYEIWRKKDRCIQLNVYYPYKIDGTQNVIKKGVYLDYKRGNYYTISHFSAEVLPALVNYDCGISDGGGRCSISAATKFLKWFVNQATIIDDLS